MAVEAKQGVTKLELLYEELTRKEIAKQQRQEKLRLKRKKKKERRYENEEKENTCDVSLALNLFKIFILPELRIEFNNFSQCSSERNSSENKESCTCSDSKPRTQNTDRHKLQVLDPKNKGPPTCKCPDCLKKGTSIDKTQSQATKKSVANNVNKKTMGKDSLKKKDKKIESRKSSSEEICDLSNAQQKNLESKQTLLINSTNSEEKDTEKSLEVSESQEWNLYGNSVADLDNVWLDRPHNMWMEMKEHMIAKMTDRDSRSSSEHSSPDPGYSSEHYISSGSLPGSPEGSDVACSDGFCNHEENCSKPPEKPAPVDSNTLEIAGYDGLSLLQTMEVN